MIKRQFKLAEGTFFLLCEIFQSNSSFIFWAATIHFNWDAVQVNKDLKKTWLWPDSVYWLIKSRVKTLGKVVIAVYLSTHYFYLLKARFSSHFMNQKLFSRGANFISLYWNNMKASLISSIIPCWAFYMFWRRKYYCVKLASIYFELISEIGHKMDLKAFWSTIMVVIFHHANCTLSSK